MTTIDKITVSIKATMQSVSQHQDYPNKPGLYAFSSSKNAKLKEYGKAGQIIYVGKAEDSLKQRDLNTHFKDGRTGSSTLRRSIGAILKAELKAKAFSRNGTLASPNIDNYKFDNISEAKLSKWMKDNLLVGYWVYQAEREAETLRAIEEQLIIALKPTLDLDKRTRHFNKYAPALTTLRNKCKEEARQNVINQKVHY
jgi:hypothetical protein